MASIVNARAGLKALRALHLRPRPLESSLTSPRVNLSRGIATHPYNHHASLISVLSTTVDKSSADYKENAAQMAEVMTRTTGLHEKIQKGGSAKAREKHIARGKMLPRECVHQFFTHTLDWFIDQCHYSRVTSLLDVGTPFLELSTLAGEALYPNEDVPGGGIITGVGSVQGTLCMIVANDST